MGWHKVIYLAQSWKSKAATGPSRSWIYKWITWFIFQLFGIDLVQLKAVVFKLLHGVLNLWGFLSFSLLDQGFRVGYQERWWQWLCQVDGEWNISMCVTNLFNFPKIYMVTSFVDVVFSMWGYLGNRKPSESFLQNKTYISAWNVWGNTEFFINLQALKQSVCFGASSRFRSP